MNVHSRPEGAETNQPRAERSAALGREINKTSSPEGAAQKSRPFRAWRWERSTSQGDALWLTPRRSALG